MSAWAGVVVGAGIGGVVGFVGGRLLFGKSDVGVTAAAVAAGGLIGGALSSPTASAASGPTLTSETLDGNKTIAMKAGDVVDLHAPAGLGIASVNAHGSDAVTVDTSTPTMAVVRAVKPKGARLDVVLSNGSLVVVQVTVS